MKTDTYGVYNVKEIENLQNDSLVSKNSQQNFVCCRIFFLDDTQESFEITSSENGQILLDNVLDHLEIIEKGYFGLLYYDTFNNNERKWLDLSSPMFQLENNPSFPSILYFRVKFFPAHPDKLFEEYTRYHFFLQLKRDLQSGQLLANFQNQELETALLLASYVLQSELGDYDTVMEELYKNDPKTAVFRKSRNAPPPFIDYICHMNILPYDILIKNNCDNKFSAEDLNRKIVELHKTHRGQTPADAELNFLRHVKKLKLYGVETHKVYNQNQTNVFIGVSHMGITEFEIESYQTINRYKWSQIQTISFRKHNFILYLVNNGNKNETVDNNLCILEWYFAEETECKSFWQSCIDNHAFFRLREIKQPSNVNTSINNFNNNDNHTKKLSSIRSLFASFSNINNTGRKKYAYKLNQDFNFNNNSKISKDTLNRHNSVLYGGKTEYQSIQEYKKRIHINRNFSRNNSKFSSFQLLGLNYNLTNTNRNNNNCNNIIQKASMDMHTTDNNNYNDIYNQKCEIDTYNVNVNKNSNTNFNEFSSAFYSSFRKLRLSFSTKINNKNKNSLINVRNNSSFTKINKEEQLKNKNKTEINGVTPSQGILKFAVINKNKSNRNSFDGNISNYKKRLNPDFGSNPLNKKETNAMVGSIDRKAIKKRNNIIKNLKNNCNNINLDSKLLNGHYIEIEMQADKQGKFGFNITGGHDQNLPVIISHIKESSPADLSYPRLCEGDQIIYINGRSVCGLSHAEICGLISQSLYGTLNLIVIPFAYISSDIETFYPNLSNTDNKDEKMIKKYSIANLEELQKDLTNGTLIKDFMNLPRINTQMPCSIGQKPQNAKFNRYKDILPYDNTRVVLKDGKILENGALKKVNSSIIQPSLQNDYINANYINMSFEACGIVNRYIATQGPLPNTISHFWQMVWQEQSTIIVMLTTEWENGRAKCAPYWPTDHMSFQNSTNQDNNNINSNTLKLSDALLEVMYDKAKTFEFKRRHHFPENYNTDEIERPIYIVRTFRIKHMQTLEEREIIQMQYLGWPDHGIPNTPEMGPITTLNTENTLKSKVINTDNINIQEFVAFIDHYRRLKEGSVEPVIVHCSAGIGRTGVLILMESGLDLLENHLDLDPLQLVTQMRQQRCYLIQTSAQLTFVCRALLHIFANTMKGINNKTKNKESPTFLDFNNNNKDFNGHAQNISKEYSEIHKQKNNRQSIGPHSVNCDTNYFSSHLSNTYGSNSFNSEKYRLTSHNLIVPPEIIKGKTNNKQSFLNDKNLTAAYKSSNEVKETKKQRHLYETVID